MKNTKDKIEIKIKIVLTLLSTFFMMGVINLNIVKADTTDALAVETYSYDEVIFNSIELKNDNFLVIGDYNAELTLEDENISTFNSYTVRTANHTAKVYKNLGGLNVHVATLSHSITYYTYTDGNVHIYNSTVSHKPEKSYIDTSVALHNVVNTDGELSWATVIFDIEDTLLGEYALYYIDFYLYENDIVPTVSTGHL